MKKLLKKLGKTQEAPPPRAMEEIQAEYNRLSGQAGQNQYQAYVLGKDLERINQRLVEVNQEAAFRNKLDAEAKAKETDQAATAPETSQQ